MQLAMNSLLAVGYKSRSQIARIVTESWAADNLYCVACDRPRLD
jgi:type II restriction enzyme